MFKLKKILGARNNNPEIVEVEVTTTIDCVPGRLYCISAGSINIHAGMKASVIFTPIEYVAGDYTKKKVRGFYISPDMVFETKMYGDIANYTVGSVLEAHVNENGEFPYSDGVVASYGDFALVHDVSDYNNTGKVSVRFLVDF